jgi:tetratricopeptide (TPR) repeat protein
LSLYWKAYECVAQVECSETNECAELKGTLLGNLSAVYFMKKDYHQTENICSKALVFRPNDEKVLFRRGVANYHLQNFYSAIQDFQKIQSGGESQIRAQKYLNELSQRCHLSSPQVLPTESNNTHHSKEVMIEEKMMTVGNTSASSSTPQETTPNSLTTSTNLKQTPQEILQMLDEFEKEYLHLKPQLESILQQVEYNEMKYLTKIKPILRPIQFPILSKYGFLPNDKGVMQMQQYVHDLAKTNREIAKRAEQVRDLIYRF